MPPYEPGVFGQLYKTPRGRKIWAFLNRDNIVMSLETACRLGKPAVKGIEEQILEEFSEAILDNRVKQMIGHMVRQILESRGWVLAQSEVRVSGVPFIKAARYRRPEWHAFHAYRNADNPRDVAITAARRTDHLPADARWTYYLTFESPLKAAVAFSLRNFDELREIVREQGFQRIEVPRLLRRG